MAFYIPDIVEDIDWSKLCRGCGRYDEEKGYCTKGYSPDESDKCDYRDCYLNFFDALYRVEGLIRAIADVRDEDDLDSLKAELEKFK